MIAADTHRGLRLFTAFEQRWTDRGGKLRGRLLVDDPAETNAAMGTLLGSGSSDQRIRSIERAFDLPVDARGRGRTDFECIFMLAPDPATARTWRPLLVFHMSGDVPVYATSAINDGEDDTRNRDLNGVMFVETPAMLPPQYRQPTDATQGAGPRCHNPGAALGAGSRHRRLDHSGRNRLAAPHDRMDPSSEH